MFQLRSLKRPQSRKSQTHHAWAYAEDVVDIITPESGRADAANQSFSKPIKIVISLLCISFWYSMHSRDLCNKGLL